jgi:hypothetical protein
MRRPGPATDPKQWLLLTLQRQCSRLYLLGH